jgi:hypothetical protein
VLRVCCETEFESIHTQEALNYSQIGMEPIKGAARVAYYGAH